MHNPLDFVRGSPPYSPPSIMFKFAPFELYLHIPSAAFLYSTNEIIVESSSVRNPHVFFNSLRSFYLIPVSWWPQKRNKHYIEI